MSHTCTECNTPVSPSRTLCHAHTVLAEKARGFWCVSAASPARGEAAVAGFKDLGVAFHFEVRVYRELVTVPGSNEGVSTVFIYAPLWVFVVWASFRESANTRKPDVEKLYQRLSSAQTEAEQSALADTYLVGGMPAVEHLWASQGL